MMAAYGWVSDIDDLEGASELLEVLKKTYGTGQENIVNNSISFSIDLRMDYMGATSLEYDDDDYDCE
jgi:hypothetical protein